MSIWHQGHRVDLSNGIGMVLLYGGTTIPAGWLACEGQVMQSRNADGSASPYDALYQILGTTYGVGPEAGSFKLPDLRSRFVEGADGNINTYIEDGLVDHTHAFTGTSTSTGQRAGHYHTKGTWRITGDTRTSNMGMHRGGQSGALKSVQSGSDYKSVDNDGGYYGTIEMDTNQGGWTGSTSDPGTHRHQVTAKGTISTITGTMYNSTSTVQPKSLMLQYIIKYK